MASSATGLVPNTFDDFRSVQFWDGFFKERGSTAFEWYGDWRQLQPLLKQDCAAGKETLVVGCGNSELSADLYDSGCQDITNVDFSKLVISKMMRKNLRQRPRMKWRVGDITKLEFAKGSFDVVVDKGGLDALMGEDSTEGSKAGRKLLSEVDRVLKPDGVYLCVTLAQSHVLRTLLDACGAGWHLHFSTVPPSPDMARATLQPLFLRAAKSQPAGAFHSVTSSVKPHKLSPNREQLSEICQILDTEISARAQGEARCQQALPIDIFKELCPGRRLCQELPTEAALSSTENGVEASQKGAHATVKRSRFSAILLDVAGSAADAAIQQCCVFIIPQGKETDWLFATEEGQWQVAGQCRCRRVIIVALNRGHDFGMLEEVQQELSPLVEPLAPGDVRDIPGAIPIMTTSEGVGSRTVLEEADSTISGRIVVEDIIQGEGHSSRRMVFVSNSNLVQSEARLRGHQPAKVAPAKSSKQGKKKRSEHARLGQGRLDPKSHQLDHSVLAMEYHAYIVAGITLCGCCDEAASGRAPRGMIVGLGGGSLALFLHQFLGAQIIAVELDETVLGLARRHFGFQEEPGLLANVGDGLEAVSQFAESDAESLDFLVVDAGSGDASLAMSCPPAEFLESRFLQNASKALRFGGLLAINCVTRLQSAFDEAAKSVQGLFGVVYASEVEDNVNRVLFGVKQDPTFAQKQPREDLLAKQLQHKLQAASVDAATLSDIAGSFSALKLLK